MATEPNAMEELIAALKAAKGYMLNAKFDLEESVPKRTAIGTLNGGLAVVEAALAKVAK